MRAEQQISENDLRITEPEKSKILLVTCELAPINDNPGWFWIGWIRPLTNDDFRQLRRHMVCWRAPDLDKNGTLGLEEGWRINGEGLERVSMLDYQIFIDGVELRTPILVKFLRPEIRIIGADL